MASRAGTFGHLSQAHLKSTFEEVWRSQPRALERTSHSRFRTDDSVSHWLMSAWDMVSGRFFPANEKRMGAFVRLDPESVTGVCETVRRRARPEICLNDKGKGEDMERCFTEVARAFDAILPDKSSFER